MRLLPSLSSALALLLAVTPFSSAVQVIESDSLNSCATNINETGFTASLFNVAFTPANLSVGFNIIAFSTISGNVSIKFDVIAYGLSVISQTIDPCGNDALKGFCPMTSGQINLQSVIPLTESVVKHIPGIAYSIPDLDGQVQVRIFSASNNNSELACVQADLSNGKTVYQKGVGWTTAVIAGLALLVSAIVSGLGHSNTAAHVAANAMSLFGFFQAQALFGMTAVNLPPVVSAWTQNFQWSMGIIHVGFIQDIATWYQRSTGGTPANIFSQLATTSVEVQKRSLDVTKHALSRAAKYMSERGLYVPVKHHVARNLSRAAMHLSPFLAKRINNANNNAETTHHIVVQGIQRVGFRAGIDLTDIFMTGYIFFIIFIMLIIIGVVSFKWILEFLARSGKVKGDKFQDFRNGWTTVLKGILFRLVSAAVQV